MFRPNQPRQREPRADQALFETIQIAHCLDQGVDIGLINDKRRKARLDYLRWFWLRAVDPLLSVDPGFEARLAEYLADFYVDMDRAQAEKDRNPRDLRILHTLLAVRVQRLPEPLQSQLYRDPRMRAFGRTHENITVAGADFEAAAFWRAVRKTLKYGKARLRFRRKPGGGPRFVRLRRDGDSVILTGAIRARIGDATLTVAALDGAARAGAIDRIVGDLRLEPARAGRIAADAAAAPTITATVRILRDAGQTSAASLYADATARLGRGERVRLDMLAPVPFDAVLAAMGITDTATPFADALDAARRARGAEDARAGLIETAGIPVLRAEPDAALLDAAVVQRARTPMAIVHVAAAARALGRPAAETVGLVEAFLGSVERYGRLFMTLLRWTHRYFVRDAAWRAAPAPRRLAERDGLVPGQLSRRSRRRSARSHEDPRPPHRGSARRDRDRSRQYGGMAPARRFRRRRARPASLCADARCNFRGPRSTGADDRGRGPVDPVAVHPAPDRLARRGRSLASRPNPGFGLPPPR